MRIAIVGVGGIGLYLGGMLAHANEEVTFVARGASLAAIRARGITIRIDTVGTVTSPAAATDDPATIGPVDLIVVCVKTYDLDAAAEQIRPLVGSETAILTIQNGVDAAERVGTALGIPDVLAAALYFSATRKEPGVIEKIGGPGGRIVLGNPAGGPALHGEQVAATLRAQVSTCSYPPTFGSRCGRSSSPLPVMAPCARSPGCRAARSSRARRRVRSCAASSPRARRWHARAAFN